MHKHCEQTICCICICAQSQAIWVSCIQSFPWSGLTSKVCSEIMFVFQTLRRCLTLCNDFAQKVCSGQTQQLPRIPIHSEENGYSCWCRLLIALEFCSPGWTEINYLLGRITRKSKTSHMQRATPENAGMEEQWHVATKAPSACSSSKLCTLLCCKAEGSKGGRADWGLPSSRHTPL